MRCQFCKEDVVGDCVKHGWKLWHPRCYDWMLYARPSTPDHMRVAIWQRLYVGVADVATIVVETVAISVQAEILGFPPDFTEEVEGENPLLM